jgi:Uma2 family endonuclease
MVDAASELPSFDELYATIRQLPPNLTGEILEPGVLRTTPRPGKAHRRAARSCLSALLRYDHNVGGDGWWIETEIEIRFPGDRLLVPDFVGWRVERVPDLPDQNPLGILPDWCCEVLSPGTAEDDKNTKLPLYARSGVAWIWLVDPALRLLEVYETLNGFPALRLTARDDERAVLPPFDADASLGGWWLAAESRDA